nr:hypothetical protein [Elusimicrobiota bacterium]
MTAAMREAGEVWPGTGASVLYLPVEGQVPGVALSDRESAVYAAFRLEKRRREWLAGRLAAKALLSADGPAPAACDIGMDKFGRPCCGQALVSISHS